MSADVSGEPELASVIERLNGALMAVVAQVRAERAMTADLARSWQDGGHLLQQRAEGVVKRFGQQTELLDALLPFGPIAAELARRGQSVAVLLGQFPGQQWNEALPLGDVVRAAAGRIQDFARVNVTAYPDVQVAAEAVEPVIHVLAELLDNAARFSRPTSDVLVTFDRGSAGWTVIIDDHGIGVHEDDAADVARRLQRSSWRSVAELGNPPRLGLAVVAAYTKRLGVEVQLTKSPKQAGMRAQVQIRWVHLRTPDGRPARPAALEVAEPTGESLFGVASGPGSATLPRRKPGQHEPDFEQFPSRRGAAGASGTGLTEPASGTNFGGASGSNSPPGRPPRACEDDPAPHSPGRDEVEQREGDRVNGEWLGDFFGQRDDAEAQRPVPPMDEPAAGLSGSESKGEGHD
ncbi:ATP-binding protein [Amycolatopsis magusensis]|uniref:ATP-binding protein n=1 Tax=Amycolatopsis magusensis TaxID=882444 RepID=UPI0037BC5784